MEGKQGLARTSGHKPSYCRTHRAEERALPTWRENTEERTLPTCLYYSNTQAYPFPSMLFMCLFTCKVPSSPARDPWQHDVQECSPKPGAAKPTRLPSSSSSPKMYGRVYVCPISFVIHHVKEKLLKFHCFCRLFFGRYVWSRASPRPFLLYSEFSCLSVHLHNCQSIPKDHSSCFICFLSAIYLLSILPYHQFYIALRIAWHCWSLLTFLLRRVESPILFSFSVLLFFYTSIISVEWRKVLQGETVW